MSNTDNSVRKQLKALERSLPRPHYKRKFLAPVHKVQSWSRKIKYWLLIVFLALILIAVILPPFYWPVRAPISSGFLFRLKPDSKMIGLEIHHGIDLAAPRGTIVHTTAVGIVNAAGHSPELGNYVSVVHLLGFKSLYAHLDRINTHMGALVIPGLNVLGKVGSTGRSTGPHLHFGIYLLGIACPPEILLMFHSLRYKILGW